MIGLLLAGCAPPETDALADVIVDQAELREYNSAGFVLVAGFHRATGGPLLAVLDVEGEVHEVPVDVGSTVVGLLMVANVAGLGTHLPLTLPPGREVRGNELFGTYQGSFENLTLIGGVQSLRLENDAGVRIDRRLTSLGVGAAVAHQWLRIRPEGEGNDGLIDLPDPLELEP